MLIALDTNVLIHLTNHSDPRRNLAMAAWRKLQEEGHQLCVAPQNLVEFWSVATKPLDHNGLGFTPFEADAHLRFIENTVALLSEDDRLYPTWRQIVTAHRVSGRQVHDARLAAIFRVHDVSYLVTFDIRDFRRYSWLTVLSPEDVLKAAL